MRTYTEILLEADKAKRDNRRIALTDEERKEAILVGSGVETLFNWDKAARKIVASGCEKAFAIETWKDDNWKSHRNKIEIFNGSPILEYNFDNCAFGGVGDWYLLEIDGELTDCTALKMEFPTRWKRTSWPRSALRVLSNPPLSAV